MDSDFLDPGKQAITGGTLGPKSGSLKIGVGNYKFERRLIAERTRDGMNAARAKGRTPGRPPLDQKKLDAAMLLMKGGMPPTKAARQIALGRSALYREIQANAKG
jgi:DNA invertase Pin-like site-specific DNA recombinase